MQQNNEAAGTVKVTDDVKTVEDRNPTMRHRRKLITLLRVARALLLLRRGRKMRAYVRSSHLEHQPSRFKLFEEYYNDEGSDDLRQFLRFSRADFDSLHETLRANLEKPRNHTYPISSKHRLAVFLRFIGHGPSFKAMETSFGIGYTTVYKIILEVAHAVLDSSLQLPLPTTDDLPFVIKLNLNLTTDFPGRAVSVKTASELWRAGFASCNARCR
ncbi:hypothetical protein QR680_015545 [Steinernema hermaphroditum]|uniref:Transposase Helix-turn-helix domain-containing protein n=1 Tax=Steinernema hermaphroditum TaxID=289476 RepID=A0AA39HA18_9BILA|nr:hypothetical protein QR680_015545 [Steinernema hermaphroditum]